MPVLNVVFTPPSTPPANGYRVRYRIKGSGAAYSAPVSPNPTGSPIAITQGIIANRDYEVVIQSDCGGGIYSSPIIVQTTSCFCDTGYTEAPDHSYCYKLDQVAPTPPSGALENTVESNNLSYSNYGSYIYDPGFNINGTGTANQIPLTNPFWHNADRNLVDGPLNRTGLWSTTTIDGVQDVGFAVCFDVMQTTQYYIGMGGDNSCVIKIDGVTIVNQDVPSIDAQYGGNSLDTTFKVWHIYPITLTAGPHIIEILGHNTGSAAAFGAEIYRATKAELEAVQSYVDLGGKLIFSTKDFVGQPVQLGSGGVGYSCPVGYSLNSCVEPYVCTKRLTKACGDIS